MCPRKLPQRRSTRETGFHDYVMEDLLGATSGVISRAMFGGWGLYKDGVIFAIIVEGELFVKADAEGRRVFEAEGSRPFTYTTRTRRKPVAMPYWLVPEAVLESRDRFEEWVRHAVRAATFAVPRRRGRGVVPPA